LFWWAGIVLTGQLGMMALIRFGFSRTVLHTLLAGQLVAMALPVWSQRAWHNLTASAAQRQLWSIGVAFIVACLVMGPVQTNLVGVDKMYEFYYIPTIAVLSGMCFFVLASNYWGWLYGVSLAFFVWAYVSSLYPAISPVGFSLLWSFSLVLIGMRLRRRAKPA
jgi:hypothetical protein